MSQKKATCAFPNREERSLVRGLIAAQKYQVATHNTLTEALNDIIKAKNHPNLLVLDGSASNKALTSKWSDKIETDVTVTDFLEQICEAGPRPTSMVILTEDAPADLLVYLTELGVDLVVKRPVTTQDITAKIKEVIKIHASPHPLTKILDDLREQCRKGDHENVAKILKPVYEKQPRDLRVGMLYAKCLLKIDTQIDEAIQVLRNFEKQLTFSTSIKLRLRQAYLSKASYEQAFFISLDILGSKPTIDSYNNALECAKLWAAELSSPIQPYGMLISALQKLSEEKHFQEACFDVAKLAFESINDAGDLDLFWDQISSGDTKWLTSAIPTVTALVKKLEPLSNDLFVKIAGSIQKEMPGEPITLYRFILGLIELQKFSEGSEILRASKAAGREDAEFYAASAELALAEGFLREASDFIHIGRKSKPTDERWTKLSDKWKEAKAKAEAAQG